MDKKIKPIEKNNLWGLRALAIVELNSYIAILDVSKHTKKKKKKKTPGSSGAIAKFFS